jgi:hypothetical protein
MGANDDADVTNDLNTSAASAGPFGVTGEWDDSDTSGSVTVGGYDVLRYDPVNDTPLVGDVYGGVQLVGKMLSGESDWGELYAIGGDVADLALNAVVYAADPVNYLLSAGLGFLIDVVQPLEDLIGLVTGNGERMGGEIAKWNRVGAALKPLAQEIRDAADQGLIGWHGDAAEAAKRRLHLFADGVESLTNDVDKITMILGLAKTLMETAEQLVISFLATFIEWLIFTWVPALAAAVPTAGASTAAAGAATTVQATATTARALSFIERVGLILKRLRTVLWKIEPRAMQRAQAAFQLRQNGQFAPGWISTGTALGNTAHDWRTWAQPGVKFSVNLLQGLKTLSGDDGMTSARQDEALDGDR